MVKCEQVSELVSGILKLGKLGLRPIKLSKTRMNSIIGMVKYRDHLLSYKRASIFFRFSLKYYQIVFLATEIYMWHWTKTVIIWWMNNISHSLSFVRMFQKLDITKVSKNTTHSYEYARIYIVWCWFTIALMSLGMHLVSILVVVEVADQSAS